MKKKAQLQYERQCRDYLFSNVVNCHIERVAGSGSQENAVCDLIMLTLLNKYLIEVKATKEIKYCFCGEQRKKLIETAVRVGAVPILAVRFKRRKWVLSNILIADSQTVKVADKCVMEGLE